MAFVTGKYHRKVNSAMGTYQDGVKMVYLRCIFWACALKRRGEVFTQVRRLVDLLFCAMYCIQYIRSYTVYYYYIQNYHRMPTLQATKYGLSHLDIGVPEFIPEALNLNYLK